MTQKNLKTPFTAFKSGINFTIVRKKSENQEICKKQHNC
uniref:Uncharacterized protein n=1 Tax=Anguilla anguilla TaxID=7936 RepID=A0A0E9PLD2_ANGAN